MHFFFFYLIMPIITNKNENYRQILHNSEKKNSLIFDRILLKKKNVRFTISMEIIPLVNQRKAPFS